MWKFAEKLYEILREPKKPAFVREHCDRDVAGGKSGRFHVNENARTQVICFRFLGRRMRNLAFARRPRMAHVRTLNRSHLFCRRAGLCKRVEVVRFQSVLNQHRF